MFHTPTPHHSNVPSVTSSCGVSLSVLCLILSAENLDWKMRLVIIDVKSGGLYISDRDAFSLACPA